MHKGISHILVAWGGRGDDTLMLPSNSGNQVTVCIWVKIVDTGTHFTLAWSRLCLHLVKCNFDVTLLDVGVSYFQLPLVTSFTRFCVLPEADGVCICIACLVTCVTRNR